jgi:hypothetical protein
MPKVEKIGSLNLRDLEGPAQACSGYTLPLPYMKTFSHLWQHLAEFFLEWEMFRIKFCRENQNPYFAFNNFFPSRKLCHLWGYVQKNDTAGQATDGDILRHMSFACWVIKATNTHSKYVTLIDFPRRTVLNANAPGYYVTRVLTVLFLHKVLISKTCYMYQLFFL